MGGKQMVAMPSALSFLKSGGSGNAQPRSRAVALLRSAGIVLAMLGVSAVASRMAVAATTAQSTVRVQTNSVYYQLPRWCAGAKMTAFCSDYAGGNYPSDIWRAVRTTRDGKNWIACLKDMKLGFIGASMTTQGRPPNKGTPANSYDDWRVAANAVVASGGGIMIEYMGGPVGIGPNGSTQAPETPTNVDPGNWSPQNCADWADYMASVNGRDKIWLFEFYNEPDTMNSHQLGSSGVCWYSYDTWPSADFECEFWAINHQQDYYKAVKPKYPNAVVCAASHSTPAGIYNQGWVPSWLQGYAGARISPSNPNTKYMDAVSIHAYGYNSASVTSTTPGAPSGAIQSTFNAIFYPKSKDPGNVSGYKAGVDQWINLARTLPAGKTMGVVNTEWWAYGPPELPDGRYANGGVEGSRSAAGDVVGWIVHCQNADRWQFKAIEFHAVNVAFGYVPDSKGYPTEFDIPDCMFCSYDGAGGFHLYRTGRYFAVKDICARFANNYPSLLRCSVQGPPSPAGPRHNSPGTQIQSCAGLNKTGTKLAVCLANIGNSTQTVKVAFGRRATGAVSGVKIPPTLPIETPLTKLTPAFTDSAHQAVNVTLEGYTAALIEVPL